MEFHENEVGTLIADSPVHLHHELGPGPGRLDRRLEGGSWNSSPLKRLIQLTISRSSPTSASPECNKDTCSTSAKP